MARRRLTKVVPIRVTPRHKRALQRLAREGDTDVSDVVRRLIDEGLERRTRSGAEASSEASFETPGQVGAAA